MKKIKAIFEYVKKEKYILLTLIALILVGLLCWLGSETTEQFGLNFLTEMLGVAITILIIDRLIQEREQTRTIPQKLAAYEDIRLYVARYIGFWSDAFRLSVPEEDPETFEDFFSEQGINKIFDNLYLDSEPNVSPPRKWWDWIVHNAKEFKENGDRILNRYSYKLDPIAFGFLHHLTESSFNTMLFAIPALRQSDQLYKFPRVKVLGAYAIKPEKEDFQAILGLIKWCNDTYFFLKKYNSEITKPPEYYHHKNKTMPPKCMIPKDILEEQLNDWNQFREQSK